ncbi:DUF3168 domain-containing protein [Algimonas porphyrae]|uniref:DUF3168 domain-containing protein n=1 Tax=Algimonas porphyrae TaxID=1128113 RepID=A0ABQ5V1D6_9PROT|nr:DUF3168 domain-containing protein [Algimonas porphyrae]GLQ20391.1 hypothetical protein GCM10007854_13460 [Algimonas porphyrae]
MFQADLVARLRADATLTSQLGTSGGNPAINWLERPSKASLPSVTLSEVSSAPTYIQGGRLASTEATVQLDVWATTPLATIAALDRVVAVLETEAEHGSTFFFRGFVTSGPRSMRAEDIPGGMRVHRRTADITFTHKPA